MQSDDRNRPYFTMLAVREDHFSQVQRYAAWLEAEAEADDRERAALAP